MVRNTRNRGKKRQRYNSDEESSDDQSTFDPDDLFPENFSSDEAFAEYLERQAEAAAQRRAAKRLRMEQKMARGRGRGRGRGGRRGGGGAGVEVPPVEMPSTLFEIVKVGRPTLQHVVDEWIEAYKQDRDSALLELMQFFIQCSGCKGTITPQMQASMEHAQIIRKMTEEFDEESGDYPLIITGPQWKKFRSNFCDFVQVLVRQCQYSIIYDQYLMDNIISLLTGLSDSQVRAFRHTATLAGMFLLSPHSLSQKSLRSMKLMTALVDVALNLSINLDNTQRQYEAERQKNRDKRATERLEMLMSKRQEVSQLKRVGACVQLEENMEEIKNMLTYMFKSVFVHRYRDTLPEIRSICMYEIGQWMKKFHQHFLDDSYLKYIGWTLHDKVTKLLLLLHKVMRPNPIDVLSLIFVFGHQTAMVVLCGYQVGDTRLKCLQALMPLYGSEELTSKLELFTNKFKDRIVAMTLDKEYEVAVHAVKLVISIHKYHREILTDKDCEHVYELVYSSHRAVAQAAGEFLNERLFQPDESLVLRTKRGKKRSINTPLIRDLVQFFIESELHEHGAYLVDSLIESNPMMKDWECMTDLLLEEPGPAEEPLDDRQEASLIEILVCCVRQAATGEPPVGRCCHNRKQPSAKELKQVADDRVKLTEHFIQTLPALLQKYLADTEKMANLMAIPQWLELEIYTTSRQEKSLDQLLRLVLDVVERHNDTEVLEACAKTYEAMCHEELAIQSRCAVARGTLVDILVQKYRRANENFNPAVTVGQDEDEDQLYHLSTAIKKVAIFYSCHNLTPWNIWDYTFENWIQGALGGQQRAKYEEIIKHAVTVCSMGVLWDLSVLDDTSPQPTAIQALQQRLSVFMEAMRDLLSSSTPLLQEEAFVTICDQLVVFSRQLGENQGLQHLVYEPDRQIQTLLAEFVQRRVFVEDDDGDEQDEHTKIEELHKRRNFLASFCKLVVYNIINTRQAADVFKQYVKDSVCPTKVVCHQFYNDYGDIIKATLGKAREINKVTCARTMAISLTSLFNELRQPVNRHSELFQAIKELAKRFALSFGLDQLRNREAVAALHQEGILFACTAPETQLDLLGPPPNLPFLDILNEFTNKLMKQDKKVVLAYLDRHIQPNIPGTRSDDWQPLLQYRNSMVHGEETTPIPGLKIPQPGRQYRGRKRARDEDEGRLLEDDLNMDPDSDAFSDDGGGF
ncbi:STAG2 [Cordylochernes scorpioides]|uniref:STAG2 n=1 Tax=Cordylochernes scorpioides TaxID=51811 RepID=A0ABY6KX37_9ARAC|nr:STAG2 [Cordylochernes scorpioides]